MIYIYMVIMPFVYLFFIRRDTYEISSAQHAIKGSMKVERVIQVHLVSLGERFSSLSRSGRWALQSWMVQPDDGWMSVRATSEAHDG